MLCVYIQYLQLYITVQLPVPTYQLGLHELQELATTAVKIIETTIAVIDSVLSAGYCCVCVCVYGSIYCSKACFSIQITCEI